MQISWFVIDEYDRVVVFRDYIINPVGFSITHESSRIHGITDEFARKNGAELYEVLSELEYTISECDIIVGHNLEFDIRVLQRAAFLYSYSNKYCGNDWSEIGFLNRINIKVCCTMKGSLNFLKEKGIYKFPKLSELYHHIFKNKPIGLHNSSIDMQITYEVYSWLIKNKKLVIQ